MASKNTSISICCSSYQELIPLPHPTSIGWSCDYLEQQNEVKMHIPVLLIQGLKSTKNVYFLTLRARIHEVRLPHWIKRPHEDLLEDETLWEERIKLETWGPETWVKKSSWKPQPSYHLTAMVWDFKWNKQKNGPAETQPTQRIMRNNKTADVLSH